jgi:hypothetical protein
VDPIRIAAALKTLADRMDALPVPDRLATRDAIPAVVYGDGFEDEFARIWEQDGREAAEVWAADGIELSYAAFDALFPGAEPFRFIPGAELRAIADQLTAA